MQVAHPYGIENKIWRKIAPKTNFKVLRSEIPSGKCAKYHTVAASNNRDYPTRSLYYCLFAPHIACTGVILLAHPVRGESHIRHNANRVCNKAKHVTRNYSFLTKTTTAVYLSKETERGKQWEFLLLLVSIVADFLVDAGQRSCVSFHRKSSVMLELQRRRRETLS